MKRFLILGGLFLNAAVAGAAVQSAQDNFEQGNIAYKKGDLGLALAAYEEAIKKDPQFGRAYNNRGTLLIVEKKYAAAIGDFSRAIEINSKDAAAYNNRGHAYAKIHHLPEALADCTKAIELDPSYAKAYNIRALVYFHLKEYDKALADVQKAEELGAPVDLDFLNKLWTVSKKPAGP